MDANTARKQILSAYEFYLKHGEFEGPSLIISKTLKEFPECVDVFIEKFNSPSKIDDREILAQIVLEVLHYQPAIDFLKNELGWDDFTGYAGFPES